MNEDVTKSKISDFDLQCVIDSDSKILTSQIDGAAIRRAALNMRSNILICLSRILTSLDCGDSETAFEQANDLFAAINHDQYVARDLGVGPSSYGHARSQESE